MERWIDNNRERRANPNPDEHRRFEADWAAMREAQVWGREAARAEDADGTEEPKPPNTQERLAAMEAAYEAGGIAAFLAEAARAKRIAPPTVGEIDGHIPDPVLWGDLPDRDRLGGSLIQVGEVCLLGAAGGSRKSTTTLAIALAAALDENRIGGVSTGALARTRIEAGRACGIRTARGPAAILSYEDSGAIIKARMLRLAGEAFPAAAERVHVFDADAVGPLYAADAKTGQAQPSAKWGRSGRTCAAFSRRC